MDTSAIPIRDQIIARATGFNSLVRAAQAYDPALAEKLTTKAAIYSKTNWAVPLSLLIAFAASHYGFALDTDATALIICAVGTITTWVMRRLSTGAVAGVVSVPNPAPAA